MTLRIRIRPTLDEVLAPLEGGLASPTFVRDLLRPHVKDVEATIARLEAEGRLQVVRLDDEDEDA